MARDKEFLVPMVNVLRNWLAKRFDKVSPKNPDTVYTAWQIDKQGSENGKPDVRCRLVGYDINQLPCECLVDFEVEFKTTKDGAIYYTEAQTKDQPIPYMIALNDGEQLTECYICILNTQVAVDLKRALVRKKSTKLALLKLLRNADHVPGMFRLVAKMDIEIADGIPESPSYQLNWTQNI